MLRILTYLRARDRLQVDPADLEAMEALSKEAYIHRRMIPVIVATLQIMAIDPTIHSAFKRWKK